MFTGMPDFKQSMEMMKNMSGGEANVSESTQESKPATNDEGPQIEEID
jgi:hypothetical protein